MDVAVHARDGRAYDYRRRALRFTVAESTQQRSIGLYLPEHEWQVEAMGARTDIDWLSPGHEAGHQRRIE